jgi:hypothetical protein
MSCGGISLSWCGHSRGKLWATPAAFQMVPEVSSAIRISSAVEIASLGMETVCKQGLPVPETIRVKCTIR